MKCIAYLTLSFAVFIGLQGCATTTVAPDINSVNQRVYSPAAQISAGSGASHFGMSNVTGR